MLQSVRQRKIGAILIAIIFMIATLAPSVDAQRRYRRYHRPSKTKHIAIGTAAGAIGGALIGGGKGALIGGGAGAATGYGIYKYKKHKYRRNR